MALGNYTQLISALETDYIYRTDKKNLLADCITFVEDDLSAGDLWRESETTVLLPVTTGSTGVDLPTDYTALKTIYASSYVVPSDPNPIGGPIGGGTQIPSTSVGNNRRLELLPDDALISYMLDPPTGLPVGYVIQGNQIYLGVTSDSDYSIIITYYAKIPSLAANGTNWLLSKSPRVYLFGVMYHYCHAVQDFETADIWKVKYEEAIQNLREAKTNESFGGSPWSCYSDLNQ